MANVRKCFPCLLAKDENVEPERKRGQGGFASRALLKISGLPAEDKLINGNEDLTFT